ncbi:lysine exporter LysO family protein [Fluviispira vulneris]|uniref:lysine exporter LysO family protein n=1 Tax=Fluviispira vulneris TaxID=2763012 RepID=UPI001648E87D|nr:lysine exporter LysO family protein [Fluviispira vulneris]
MGLSISYVPNILHKLFTLGFNAFVLALCTSFFVIFFIVIYKKIFSIKTQKNIKVSDKRKSNIHFLDFVKDPIVLCLFVVFGFLLGYLKIIPSFEHEFIVTILLCFMVFFIGIKLAFSQVCFKKIFLQKSSLIVALITVLGSLSGGAFSSLFLDLSLKNSLALSSGFGWYTLSGVLLSKMDEPILASTVFLCDLFREIFALILLPIFSKIGRNHEAIAASGGAAMDVALPMIEKHCGNDFIPLALISGAVLTVLVPFLIPFFYYL